jgi:hypothetical protein
VSERPPYRTALTSASVRCVKLPDVHRFVTSLPQVELPPPVSGVGSVHYAGDDRLREGWINGHSIVVLDHGVWGPRVWGLVSDLGGEPRQVAISRLWPGGVLREHRDAEVPGMRRYHVPLTERGSLWWDEVGGWLQLVHGFVYGPMPYRALHKVINTSTMYCRDVLLVDVVDYGEV